MANLDVSDGSDDEYMPQKRQRTSLGRSTTMVKASEIFTCTYENCGKVFSRRKYFNTHMTYHLSKTKFVCTEPKCGKSFNYRHNLMIHMRLHNDERPFDCPQDCGKSFRTKGNMMDHLRRHYAVK